VEVGGWEAVEISRKVIAASPGVASVPHHASQTDYVSTSRLPGVPGVPPV
jgi:hypothetical protein